MRLLLINPNTSVHITRRLAASARGALAAGDVLTALTAATGPAAVRTREQLQVAEESALAMAAAHAPGHDAVILGISLDGSVRLLRRRHPRIPVIGMTEAALLTACLRTERVGLLTLGAALLPAYRQRVEEVGVGSRMAGFEAVEAESAFSASADPEALPLLDLLAAGGERLREGGAESIVLAGAVLCGYAEALELRCAMPVFDGIACAVQQAGLLTGLQAQ